MTGDELPDNGHVVRHIRPRHHDDGRVHGSAFYLRLEEPTLSVNWLECFPERTKSQQVNEVKRLFRFKKLMPTERFAELNVGRVKMHVRSELDTLRLLHDPSPPTEEYEADPSHSEVTGLPTAGSPESELIGDMIAQCIEAVHPAV